MNRKALRTLLIVMVTVCSAVTTTKVLAQNASKCSLTEAQSRKAVDAFAKVAAFVLKEPRCVNCHGGVNPYIDGIGLNPADPTAPASLMEHGGGAIPKNTDGTVEAACMKCHNHMAPKRDGSPTLQWFTAASFHSFVDKNATTLCRQFKKSTGSPQELLGHLTDDNGGNNFAQTAFNGDRGLDEDDLEGFSVTVQKPSISKPEFIQLVQNWINAMGGKFQGDENCGCELTHDEWSGVVRYVIDSKGDQGHTQWSDWTNHSLSMITIDVKDGVGTITYSVHGKDVVQNRSGGANGTKVNHGSSTVDTSVQKTVPARINVLIDPRARTYMVSLGQGYLPTIGKKHIENCDDSNGCSGADVDVYPFILPVGVPLNGALQDPNRIQGSATVKKDGQGRSHKGISIETVTVDLWRSGSTSH
jgi:hypothetical protein